MFFIDIHTHKNLINNNVRSIINSFPENYDDLDKLLHYSMGIHPWYVNLNYQRLLDVMSYALSQKHIVAVGEAGLDRKCNIDYSIQNHVFLKQVELAADFYKPVIVHAVKTHYDIISLRKKFINKPPWIIHGFNGNLLLAQELVKHGFFISFGGNILKDSDKNRVLSKIPLKNIFFETDISEDDIEAIYKKGALILNVSMSSLVKQIMENYEKCFRK